MSPEPNHWRQPSSDVERHPSAVSGAMASAPQVALFLALFLALTVAFPRPVMAQDDESGAEDFPSAELSAAAADEDPLELGDLEIVAEGLSFEQEFTLRLLREALDKPKSQKEEDRDEWVCWVDKATGSRLNYLNCARNGDLWVNGGLGRYPD